jgi:DNA helicase-2/ATP-dependent DNA helicase PcrA
VQESATEGGPTLTGFLETASLAQDIDSLDEATGAVTLMTLHAAKGLEFPVVYIIAVEQNLIPHERSLRENDPRQLEEERRLLFVGITRAEEKLVLTHTQRREMHGRSLSTIPSDFMHELIVTRKDHTGVDEFQFGDDTSSEFHDPDHDSIDQSSDLHHSEPAYERYPSVSDFNQKRKKTKGSLGIPGLEGLNLTTGAALQAGTNDAVELPKGFSVGMQVRHPRYGLGTVVDVSGMSRRRTLTVEFEVGDRRESFVESKCPLQPVGLR